MIDASRQFELKSFSDSVADTTRQNDDKTRKFIEHESFSRAAGITLINFSTLIRKTRTQISRKIDDKKNS